MSELQSIRDKLQKFSGPNVRDNERRKALMSVEVDLSESERKKLRNQRAIVMCVSGQIFVNNSVVSQGGMIECTSGEVVAIVNSSIKIIYL